MIKIILLMLSTALMLIGYASIKTRTFYFGLQNTTRYSGWSKILATLVGMCELAAGIYIFKTYIL